MCTTNNIECNFDSNLSYFNDINADWNSIGKNEFSFFNTLVYGAVGKDGKFTETDPVIGAKVLDNGKSPYAKLVDIDVDAQMHSTIYGMRFGIGWEQIEEGEQYLAFKGDWSPNIIAQNIWFKLKNPNVIQQAQTTNLFGASSTTTITDIIWNPENDRNSTILKDLREASLENGNTLQVSISLYFYTRNYSLSVPHNFTLGYVVGTIGIYEEGEPLNYGGERVLIPKDPSLGIQAPMYKAAFKVYENSRVLTVDLSNALPINTYSDMLDIGPLFLAIIHKDRQCVELISSESIPYLSENWIERTAGVMDYIISLQQLINLTSSATLVVVQQNNTVEAHYYSECGQNADNKFLVLLTEAQYYVRPTGLYRAQLEYNETVEIPIYVTHLGKPAENISIGVALTTNRYGQGGKGFPIPENGVTVEDSNKTMKTTDSSGLVTFTYRVAMEMGTERYFNPTPCGGNQPNLTKLPIDGQVYHFNYGVCTTETNCSFESENIVIKGLSSNNASEPYTWERDIYPIFQQYYHLYPAMRGILNLSDYNSVTTYQNLNLLRYSMSLNFTDPNYMPVTRDISPSKQQMILDWLDNPIRNITQMSFLTPDSDDSIYDHSPQVVPYPVCSTAPAEKNFAVPSYCEADRISFDTCDHFDHIRVSLDNSVTNCTRPLFGYTKGSQNPNIQALCTIENLQEQLQEAVELEFATIPLYMTSLYSIVDGCNSEIYDLIRSVLIQEMLHMVQAANILIATGGTPIVDNASFVPSFPGRLPGCVHPNLIVYLDKLNLSQVFDVFTTIEAPNITCVGQQFPVLSNHTIAQFYFEIRDCIQTLGDTIFQPESEELQVSWPWPLQENNPVGEVHIVTDVSTATDGINEIIEQGEGTDLLNPGDLDGGQIAHYYRFQEIVCGKKLINISDNEYAYSGANITYDPVGVWPMRQNPGAEGIMPGTNCYTQAAAFHGVFRALLRELQTTFSGNPSNIFKTVELMEALQVHAKRVMRVKYDPDDNDNEDTCGPVWDYDFEVQEVVEETRDNTDDPVWYYYVVGGFVLALLVIGALVCVGYGVKKKAKGSHKTPKPDHEMRGFTS